MTTRCACRVHDGYPSINLAAFSPDGSTWYGVSYDTPGGLYAYSYPDFAGPTILNPGGTDTITPGQAPLDDAILALAVDDTYAYWLRQPTNQSGTFYDHVERFLLVPPYTSTFLHTNNISTGNHQMSGMILNPADGLLYVVATPFPGAATTVELWTVHPVTGVKTVLVADLFPGVDPAFAQNFAANLLRVTPDGSVWGLMYPDTTIPGGTFTPSLFVWRYYAGSVLRSAVDYSYFGFLPTRSNTVIAVDSGGDEYEVDTSMTARLIGCHDLRPLAYDGYVTAWTPTLGKVAFLRVEGFFEAVAVWESDCSGTPARVTVI